ncbi:PQQ-dependent sugar dehydrogenase [Dyadobacter chenwenxiniae]|uniref:PQQ-dependent sugar dehydrogenase n=1 Tax=Dyadobacter chenwenxiniae TaxID=2906456 RepID=A0A9X1TP83_9BACT|nr:PQQ-dependent sugar dehydrogenase [Dyadobacter chenwenxiniae]MCF0065293.1 PQQ-dependent sugar dehydrogenase [Dyadobacter chenwenxiniae]UON84439.1 PQQ-dependent sugar dehydrogenase [Dyadobacter chenwenxiniae]
MKKINSGFYPVFKSLIFSAVMLTLAVSCGDDDSFWDAMVPETDEEPTTTQVEGYVFYPAVQPATEANVAQLKVPAGFTVNKFAEGVGKPRILVVNSNGNVYASDREAGVVVMLTDANGDGIAEDKKTVATLKQVHGLTIYNGKMYMVTVREVYEAAMNADGTLGQPKMLINDLPDGGQHPNRTIAFGPDKKMYITVGSTCNSCVEPNPELATILRAEEDGSNRKIFASGLRNTIGFGWHPETSELWGMDHGIDWLGDDEQKEEVNQIKQNAHYGWPYIYGEGKYNPGTRPTGDTTYQQYLKKTTLPSLTYQAHAAPMSMAFYTGSMFPGEYKNDAFVAMRGSWNRSSPVGYRIVRMHFESGKPVRFEDFVTGFIVNNNRAHFGRLVGVAMHKDGSLLFSDDTNGVIYRVAYK